MTAWTTLFPSTLVLISRKYFKVPGAFNHTVPALATFMRAHALGCGGQGDEWGGGGAMAVSKVPVTPGENIKAQVGNTSTASIIGDSWVRRNDNTNIAYADRGRGNGQGGKAANSFGDVKRDGANYPGGGIGGAPASDAADFGSIGFGGFGNGYNTLLQNANPGGGGVLVPANNEFGEFIGYTILGAGAGLVCLEFFNEDPGY